MENHGTNCPMVNNTVVKDGQWPPAAQAIMANAGVRRRLSSWAHVLPA